MKIRIFALLLALLAALSLVGCKEDEPTGDDDTSGGQQGGQPTFENDAEVLYFNGVIEGTSVTFELYKDGTLYLKGEGSMATGLDAGKSQQPWYEYAGSKNSVTIKKVVVEDGITALSEQAFKNCSNLQRVELGKGITDIPRECFGNCTSLRNVIGKNVITVQDVAFQNCSSLAWLTLSASLEQVWDGAFHNAGTQATSFTLKLAGTQEEWDTAKAKMDADELDDFAIWTGNDLILNALDTVTFVKK